MFCVDSKVKVNKPGSTNNGKTGTVVSVNRDWFDTPINFLVKLDDGKFRYYKVQNLATYEEGKEEKPQSKVWDGFDTFGVLDSIKRDSENAKEKKNTIDVSVNVEVNDAVADLVWTIGEALQNFSETIRRKG